MVFIGWVRFDSFPDLLQTQTNFTGVEADLMIKRAYVTVSTPLSTNDYEIFFRRNFNADCTDCNVHVRLSYTDCGCLESAARLGCDSNPVLQTNLGLTSLYSLFFSYLNRNRANGLTTHWYDFCI